MLEVVDSVTKHMVKFSVRLLVENNGTFLTYPATSLTIPRPSGGVARLIFPSNIKDLTRLWAMANERGKLSGDLARRRLWRIARAMVGECVSLSEGMMVVTADRVPFPP